MMRLNVWKIAFRTESFDIQTSHKSSGGIYAQRLDL
jgi:hypothetical protein